MANGPQRLVLINSGRYDYAEVELRGSLQIVGPNNTGKTTLINTLQFLYLDNRRDMYFGSYTAEQTRDYYFPNQYSYILFEVLGTSGRYVLGWRGQSRVIDEEPERFLFEGPFDRDDFLHNNHQVREPKDVSSRLSLKNYRVIKSSQDHREILLLATKGEAKGLGLIVLRDNDRYPHFRETLKSLLSLSTISQDQMRAQLLMLASFSPERQALNMRELFGDDYDRILLQKQKLLRFKKQQKDIEQLLQAHHRRASLRAEVGNRWQDLLSKRQIFERDHNDKIGKLTQLAANISLSINKLQDSIHTHHASKEYLSETKGEKSAKLAIISGQAEEFSGFAEDLARAALENLKAELHSLESLLRGAEKASLEQTLRKQQQCQQIVERIRHAVAHFDRALITVLRGQLKETELESLARLFNFDLLEQTLDNGGVVLRSTTRLARLLRSISDRIVDGIYRDENILLPLPASRRNLAELENVASLKDRLIEEEASLEQYEDILTAIEQRESLLIQADTKREQINGKRDTRGRELEEGLAKQIFRFEEYKKLRSQEPRLKAELKQILEDIGGEERTIKEEQKELESVRQQQFSTSTQIKTVGDEFAAQIKAFQECSAPEFPAVSTEPELPGDFATCVEAYLKVQQDARYVDLEITRSLQHLEVALGPDYAGSDESETIQRFREELEALPEREQVLGRDWQHQLTSLQATFDQVLRSFGDIKSAADRLNRDFTTIQISNLATLRMEVKEQTEIVDSMRRLAKIEQPGLFDDSSGLEATISAFRRRFEAIPLLRYQDLFTLQFTVTGDDGKSHHYNDFRQVESHGTTITIKVLFNLLVLRSLLREDSQKTLYCEIPFFLDEIHSLDNVNRHAILATARKLGFIAITAAPEHVSEVDALYFLQPHQGRIVIRNGHRVGILTRKRGV